MQVVFQQAARADPSSSSHSHGLCSARFSRIHREVVDIEASEHNEITAFITCSNKSLTPELYY